MAKKYTGYVQVKIPIQSTKLQKELLNVVNSETAHREAHRILGEMCTPFVPKGLTGNLRRSMHVYPSCVKWESEYAHYQYTGVVYKDNFPGMSPDGNTIIGWRSPARIKKKKTNRELGVPGEYKGWKFGYTTPGTAHHWLDAAMKGRGKNNYSVAVTKMLKKLAEKNSKKKK